MEFWHHRDLLFHIAARVDDNSLRKLLYPELWDALKSLLSDDRFWYERTMYLVERPLQERLDVGTDTRDQVSESPTCCRPSWKRIYRCTLPASDLSGPLSYLPATLVHIELERPIPDTDDTWRDVSDVDVLRHLVSTGILTIRASGMQECLNAAAARPSLAMLDLFVLGIDGGVDPDRLLLCIVTHGIREAMQHALDKYKCTEAGIRYAIWLAASKDKADVLIPLLDWARGADAMLEKSEMRMEETAMSTAIQEGCAAVVELLLPRVRMAMDWEYILKTAIPRGHSALVRYALTHVHPTLDHLRLTLQNGTLATTQAILSDPRLDLSIDLADTLACVYRSERDVAAVRANVSLGPVVARTDATDIWKAIALAQHDLVRVEKLDTAALRLLSHCLGPTLLDRVKGYMLAESLSRVKSREQLGRALERSDPYALALRFVFVKARSSDVVLVHQPAPLEILDWMCETEEEGFRLAATSVVNDKISVTTELVPIRALMVCLLYPSLTLRGLLNWLREQGVTGEPLVRSARLAGLYYGHTQLTAQLHGQR